MPCSNFFIAYMIILAIIKVEVISMYDTEELLTIIRQRIREQRAKLGLSYKKLEQKTGISATSLQRYETGAIQGIPLTKLKTIAESLGIPPAELMASSKPLSDTNSDSIIYLPVYTSDTFLDSNKVKAYQAIDTSILCKGCDYFYYQSNDNSMEDAGIFSNDILLVKKQLNVENGKIAFVVLGGQTIKIRRIVNQNNILILKPENISYQMDIYSEKEIHSLSIIGQVISVTHYF